MRVTRLDEAKPYEVAKHFDCTPLRLHARGASADEAFSVGLSHFLPGGGCEMDATPIEKVYVVTEGEVTVITPDGETTLGRYDTIYLAPNEARAIQNRTNLPASMVTIIPYPPETP